MRISRIQLAEKQYYLKSDDEGTPLGVSQSLPMLLETGGLGARHLIEKLTGPEARLLVPCEPTKIVCVGLNYKLHAKETGKALPKVPLLFLKPTTALLPHGGTIVRPAQSQEVHYEGELALVIGARASHVKASDAARHILGYTILNDVTARDIQREEKTYTRCKGFDTFAPVGPHVVTGLEPSQLTLKTFVNGELRQSTGCDDMIFSVPELIEFITEVMTLEPGDIVTTGTPSGIGALNSGDTVRVEISLIGALENRVQ